MNNQADKQYKELIQTIDDIGVMDYGASVRAKWLDGTPAYTKSWISQSMKFDGTETPLLTTKRVAWKTAIKEMLWIWQMKSNRVQDLRDMGVTIWDEWEKKDGTIGKAYGYQLGKLKPRMYFEDNLLESFRNREISKIKTTCDNAGHIVYIDQVDYLLHQLKHNPTSRRHVTNLWNPDELFEMALPPCVYETQWFVKEGHLHLEVRSRSNDVGLGMPFNIFQYFVLQNMIAQVTGYKVGGFTYNIGDAHIYDRHLDVLREQVNRPTFKPPTLWINPEIKSFYDFTIDDFKLIDYQYGDAIEMEVAI